jgi:hypothetical protein
MGATTVARWRIDRFAGCTDVIAAAFTKTLIISAL